MTNQQHPRYPHPFEWHNSMPRDIALEGFPYERFATVGDIAQLTDDWFNTPMDKRTVMWGEHDLHVMFAPHADEDTRKTRVILTDEEFEANYLELPADMPAWALEWIAGTLLTTAKRESHYGKRSGYRDAQRDVLGALGLPPFIEQDIERLQERLDTLEGKL